MSDEPTSASSIVPTPLMPKSNKALRSARLIRFGLAALLVVLAVVEPDSVGRGLAAFAAVLFALWALIIPRAGEPYLVATEAGLESRFFGLLTWDEIASLHIRDKRGVRSLEIFDRDRKAMIRRARPRLLQCWMFATQSFHLPLLRISERMVSFDVLEFRTELERLADRTFPGR